MRFIPARTAVCTAADIECDLPAPRPPRNIQHHDRSGGGSCASRAAKTQSSAASSPSPRISSSASFGVISLMSWRNWCMRLTSLKKRSTIVVVLFHDFAFDVAIFLASYIIDERANFLGRQQHVAASDGAVQVRLITGKRRADIPRLNEDPRSCVDTGGQVDSGVVDDSPWIFVRSGTRRTDSGRAGWPCGAPGGAAGERDCSFERRLELRGGRVGAFAGRRHGARVVRGLSETGHGGIEEFRP